MSTKTLFEYQLAGIDKLSTQKRFMLLDEAGCGKSVQAIKATQKVRAKTVLVVCPAGLRLNWELEFKKWCSLEYLESIHLNIVSFNYLQQKKNARKLALTQYDVVIVDECQSFSSWEASQTRNFVFEFLVHQGNPYVWLLSGTPSTKSASNYHPLLSIIEPGVWGKFGDFCAKYCEQKTVFVKYKSPRGNMVTKEIKNWTGFKNVGILNASIKKISLRRLKKDVLDQVPSKIYSKYLIELDEQQTFNFNNFGFDEISTVINHNLISGHLSQARQELALIKIPLIKDLLLSLNSGFIVFAWHQSAVDEAVKMCEKLGFKVKSIKGGNSEIYRQEAILDFESGNLDCLVLSIGACGVGLNLPRASACVFLELPWSPALLNQAEDRIVRLTSKHSFVNIHYVIASKTIDEKVLYVLNNKRKGMEAVLAA